MHFRYHPACILVRSLEREPMDTERPVSMKVVQPNDDSTEQWIHSGDTQALASTEFNYPLSMGKGRKFGREDTFIA